MCIKMKKIEFFLIVTICVCIGCSANTNNDRSTNSKLLKDLNEKFFNTKSFFGKELVNHFPKRITEENITFTENLSPEMGNLEFILINKMENTQILELITTLKKKSITIYNACDSCLLVVNRFARKDNFYDIKLTESDSKLVDRDCYSSLFPVPNFWHNDYTTDSTECRLPRDFNIYVLEAKSGKHFDDKYLTDGRFMPEKWRNGYSKGVAVSEKRNVVIYWLLVW